MKSVKIKLTIFASLLIFAGSIFVGSSISSELPKATFATNTVTQDEDITNPSESVYSTVHDILHPNEPEAFKTLSDPYGTKKNTKSHVMDPLNELFVYTATTFSYSSGYLDQGFSAYENLHPTYSYSSLGSIASSRADYEDMSEEKDDMDVFTCLKVEPFDPYGTGKYDHIALLGLSIYDHSLNLGIYDISGHTLRSIINVDNYLSIFNNDRCLKPSVAKNFFDITHGDYDGDGRDTIVVFASRDSSSSYCSLFEYQYTKDEEKQYGDIRLISSSKNKLVHPLYNETPLYSIEGYSKSLTKMLLRGELKTGDFDGDGIDDLVLASNMIYESPDRIKYDPKLIATHIGVSLGSGDKKSILDNDEKDISTYLYQDYSSQNDGQYICYNAGVTIGDVDNNGANCIIACGATFHQYQSTDALWLHDDYSLYKLSYTNGQLRQAVNRDLSHNVYYGQSYTNFTSLTIFPYVSYKVEAFSYLGLGYQDAIFMNGYVFTMANTTKPTIIDELSQEINPYNQNIGATMFGYIDDVAVGNFTDFYGGYQQIVYSTIYEDNGLNSSSCSITNSVVGYFSNGSSKVASKCSQKKDHSFNTYQYSYCLASVDCDDDGALIRLNTKHYYYSDVKPLAILQAAPYFSDLYDNDHYNLQDSGDTSITISYKTGSAFGESTSYESQIGVYVEESAIVETVTETSGSSSYFENGWEESISFEVSQSFHSGSVDTVVVYQVPVFFYIYDVYDAATKSWIEGDYIVYVEAEPLFSQLTVKEYNNYAKLYNDIVATGTYDKFDKNIVPLDLSMLDGNEGNPYAYNYCEPFGESFLLGHDGGYSSYSYSIETSKETYQEESTGTYFTLCAGAGFSAFDCGAYAGINYCFNDMTNVKTSTVSSKSIEVEAIVGDIRGFAFEAQGYDLSLSRQYGFTWRLATYDTGLRVDGFAGTSTLRIYSYTVSDIYEPIGAPVLTKCETSGENDVTINWIAPENNNPNIKVKGYNVYTYETVDGVNETPVKINNTLISKDATTYTFSITNQKWERFFIRAVTDDSYSTEGLRSNEGRAKGDVGLALKSANFVDVTSENDNKYYVYKISYNDGTTFDNVYFKASTDNNGVLKTTSAFFTAKEHGYTKDYQTYLSTIDCLCSYANHLYTKDNVTSLTSCNGPTLVSSICAICGKAHNELVEEGKGHNYKDYVVAPTCSEEGYTLHICQDCGHFYKDNYVGLMEHNYITKVVAPTRDQQGYTVHICQDCGDYYIDSYVDKLSYNEFYSGHGVPSSSLGCDGDSYVDNDTFDFYEKESGKWVITGSIKGKDGVSVVSIKKTGTEGLVDTYTITYSDGNTSSFTVTNGENGITPTISINEEGYWVINGLVTEVKALGEDGKNGSTPSITISDDGYWVIDNVKTSTKAKAYDPVEELNPYVGDNGNWFIGQLDTGIKACQEQIVISNIEEVSTEGNITNYKVTLSNGEIRDFAVDGSDTSTAPYIGANGNWYINGVDSGIPSSKDDNVAKNMELIYSNDIGSVYSATYADGSSNTVLINNNLDSAESKLIFKGTGTPATSFGSEGYVYIDTTNWVAYKKVNGTWSKIADLKEVIASSISAHDGYWYIGDFKTQVPVAGNEGKQIKNVTKSLDSNNRYNFHIEFTDGTSFDYLAPEGFEPVKLTTGIIDPIDNLGNESDVYLNVKNMSFYRKVNGTWQYQGNLNNKIGQVANIEQVGSSDNAYGYEITYTDGTSSKFVVVASKDIINPTITISDGGYWTIDGNLTNVLAIGSDGKNNGAVFAPSNGNWAINGVDTGVAVNYQQTGLPAWGIALIVAGSVLLVSGTISSIVVYRKKKTPKEEK